MQEMKNRAMEHVRWQSYTCRHTDPYLACYMARMKADVRRFVEDGDPEVTSVARLETATVERKQDPQSFLMDARGKALKVTELKTNYRLLRQYDKLLTRLPSIVHEKLGAQKLQTPQDFAKALVNLVDKHTGELVEVDPERSGWSLRECAPGSASATTWGEQWHCRESGDVLPPDATQEDLTLHKNACGLTEELSCSGDQMQIQAEGNPDVVARRLNLADVLPGWSRQVFRTVCPCVGTDRWAWFRTGHVVNLGQLFLILGHPRFSEKDAAQIYQYYCTLRIVAVKRRKHVSGQSAAYTGTHLAGTKASAVKATYPHEELVEDYCALQSIDVPKSKPEFNQMYLRAVKYIHMNLLQDLSPPWMDSKFAQALPGEGLLSQFLKPTFLQWDAQQAASIFGSDVMATLETAARVVSLMVAGVLGRPLYVCTHRQKPNGGMCMNVAAMSPLLERAGGNRCFRCKFCPPTQNDEPLRMIRLYILVPKSHDPSDYTPLRTKSLHVVVHAPPQDFTWDDAAEPASAWDFLASSIADPANPKRTHNDKYCYSKEESLAIWKCARPYQRLDHHRS